MRILLAEDNTVMSHVFSFNLERSGHTVQVASDGKRALELAQELDFDVIVTDYQMPHMNGAEFCRGVRETLRHKHTPIMLCWAKGYEIDVEAMREEFGISDIVCKPFSPRNMIVRIETVVARSKSAEKDSAEDGAE